MRGEPYRMDSGEGRARPHPVCRHPPRLKRRVAGRHFWRCCSRTHPAFTPACLRREWVYQVCRQAASNQEGEGKILKSTMSIIGFVDWRGNPISRGVHGGVRAAWFIYFLTVITNIVNIPILLNLVTYLHGTMHMGVSSSATTVTNFVGATCGFALIGAFLSDSYLTRSTTILLFGPLEFLGYGLLALQAYLPSLHPPSCNIKELTNCKEIHGWNAILLYLALYIIAFGEGCVRACLPSLGADQFDHDPTESHQQSSFFNWFTFGISFGGLVGLILIVWLQNYKGWGIGLGLCAILILLGLLVFAAGLPFYRNQVPGGSPLTRILQVLVVAFRNRRLELPEKLEEAQEISTGSGTIEVLSQTNNLKFLDKACINRGKDGAWSHCSAAKVEALWSVCFLCLSAP
ncbi:hypothetical protein PVAP13_7NG221900 [Panicum virgatum]|uniref:Uncharacterized protein n=1 Tax=Panicum virgatum TaxID=38727 RepID=A0A8T0Q9V2_PANVG|nr:hypothetical protein PVAP13_7NG221900 [Panicum virgatum]